MKKFFILVAAILACSTTAHAAVAFRSFSSTAWGARTNTVIVAPAGIQNGDTLCIVFDIFNSGGAPVTPTPPTGFTLVTASPTFPVSYNIGAATIAVWSWCKFAASESGNYTVTHAATTDSQAYMFAATGSIGSVYVATKNTGMGTTTTALSVTTPTNGDLVVFIDSDFADLGNPLSPPAGTTPTFTTRYDRNLECCVLYVADGVLTTAGATGNKSTTNNNNAPSTWVGVMLVLAAPSQGRQVSAIMVGP